MKPEIKKILLYIGACIVLYVLAYIVFLLLVKAKEKKAIEDENEEGKPSSTGTSTGEGMPSFPLKWGSGTSRNNNITDARKYVRGVQRACNKWANTGIAVDGVWGDHTEAAVQKLKNAAVKPKGNDYAFGAKHPFLDCIDDVAIPLSSNSKVQLSLEGYKRMTNWHNENLYKYVVL